MNFYQNTLQWLFGQTVDTGRIAAVGIGGAGGNAIDTISQEGIGGADLISINTDAQALSSNQAGSRLQVGAEETGGLGAGADPEVGARAAKESREEIRRLLAPYDMVIITAGMGGGTGTGASPIIASIAQEMDILTIGIVTQPFRCEGRPRMETAEEGIQRLRKHTDTLILVPNDRIRDLTSARTSLEEAFRLADEVLCDAVRGIVGIITHEGLVNLDFADVERTMEDGGIGMLGVSTQFSMRQSQAVNTNGPDSSQSGIQRDSERKTHLEKAALEAISSPLFDGYSIQGADNVLVNVSVGESLGFEDVMSAVEVVQSEAGNDSEVLFGAAINEQFNDHFQVTVITTGIDETDLEGPAVPSLGGSVQSNQGAPEKMEERNATEPDPEKRNGSVG